MLKNSKSSVFTASNISSSYGSHSSGTGTGSSINAGCIGTVKLNIDSRAFKRPLNTANANKFILNDATYKKIKDRIIAIKASAPRYKLFPTGRDNDNNLYNCSSFVADILNSAGFSINYKDSDRKDLKYVTPSRILNSEIKPTQSGKKE